MFYNIKKRYLSEVPKDTRYNFIRDCIGNVYSGIFAGFYNPFIAIVGRKYFHLSPLQLSLLLAGGFMAGVLGMLVASFVPVNKENTYMAYMGFLGCAFIILMSPLLSYSQSTLYTCMCLAYYVCASFGPLYQVIIQRIYRYEVRAKLLGYSKSLGAFAAIVCTAVAGLFIEKQYFGFDLWRLSFVLGALACCGNMYFCFYKIKMPKMDIQRDNPLKFLGQSFSLLKTDRLNTLLIVVGFFYTAAYMITNTLVPIYQNDVLKIGPKEVAVLTLIQNIGWTVGYPIMGKYITAKGPVKGLIMTCILGIIMTVSYILCPGSWKFLLIFYIFFGMFLSGNDMAWMNILLYIAPAEKSTEYQSLNYFFIAIRGFVGAAGATWIIGYAENICPGKEIISLFYKGVFGVSVIAFVIAIVLTVFIFRKKTKF